MRGILIGNVPSTQNLNKKNSITQKLDKEHQRFVKSCKAQEE
jgi:hypothetical protein